MFILLLLLISCSGSSSRQIIEDDISVDRRSKPTDNVRVSKSYNFRSWNDIMAKGTSEDIISFFKEEAKEGNLGKKVPFTFSEKSVLVNHAFNLFLTFPSNRDIRIRDRAFDFLVDNYMNRQKAKENYIDPNELIDKGYLVLLLIGKYLGYESFVNFIKKTDVNLNVSTDNITPIMAAIRSNDMDKLEYMIKDGGASVYNSRGAISVAYAFWENNVEALKIFTKYCDWDHINKKIDGKIPPSSYGAINENEEVIKYALCNGLRHSKKGDVRKVWMRRIAAYATLATSTVMVKLTTNVTFGLSSLFGEIFKEGIREFLICSFTTDKTKIAYDFARSILHKGVWADGIKENDSLKREKLLFAIEKYIKSNKKRLDKDQLKIMKSLQKSLKSTDYSDTKWGRYKAKFLSECARLRPDKFININRVETLKRSVKSEIYELTLALDNEEEDDNSDNYVIVSSTSFSSNQGNLEDALSFEEQFRSANMGLPTKKEFETLSSHFYNKSGNSLQDGKYLARDEEDFIVIELNNGELNRGAKEDINGDYYFFCTSELDI